MKAIKKMILNEYELQAARDWVKDCLPWGDLTTEDEVDELTDKQVEDGIARNYDGGLSGFKMTCVGS